MLRPLAIALVCLVPAAAGALPVWPSSPVGAGVATQDSLAHHDELLGACLGALTDYVFHAQLVAGVPSDEVLFLIHGVYATIPLLVRLGEPASVEYVSSSSCVVFDVVGQRVEAAAAYEAHVTNPFPR